MGVSDEAKNVIPLKFLRKIKNIFFSSCKLNPGTYCISLVCGVRVTKSLSPHADPSFALTNRRRVILMWSYIRPRNSTFIKRRGHLEKENWSIKYIFYFAFVLMLLRYCFAYRNRKMRDIIIILKTVKFNFLMLTDTVVSRRQTADVTLGGMLQF
jgi:hypothetical protein